MQADSPKFCSEFLKKPCPRRDFFQNSVPPTLQVGQDLSGVVCMLDPYRGVLQKNGTEVDSWQQSSKQWIFLSGSVR
jgi:hypothetical protein